ncbi:hypothetical protein DPMN_023776 [Dreissena polymorpha]|uniref:Uncharacterized protein n=1 Tax=Dreissena polymorpha TaxID=45954 RepID=A0A9D4LNI8_DREPO|nr:hypothetical protein DPMN_023776 [Dreissena polymorpha]
MLVLALFQEKERQEQGKRDGIEMREKKPRRESKRKTKSVFKRSKEKRKDWRRNDREKRRLPIANGHEWMPWQKRLLRHIYAQTVGREDVWTLKREVFSGMGVTGVIAGIMVGV